VIAVCYELQQFSYHRYVPWYYTKETIQNIWNRTIQDYLVQGSFTETPKKMLCTYQIQILSCAKVFEEWRRKGLGTTWTKQKLDLR
jgi:hypothetical protein